MATLDQWGLISEGFPAPPNTATYQQQSTAAPLYQSLPAILTGGANLYSAIRGNSFYSGYGGITNTTGQTAPNQTAIALPQWPTAAAPLYGSGVLSGSDPIAGVLSGVSSTTWLLVAAVVLVWLLVKK